MESELLSYQNPKWSPSEKLTYGKVCSIKLGPFDSANRLWIDQPHRARTSYIFSEDKQAYTIYTVIYSNDKELIIGLSKLYPYQEVKTPMNEGHEKLLTDTNKKTLIRNNMWFGKYKHRLTCWIPWHLRKGGENTELVADARKFFEQNFSRENCYIRHCNHHYGDNLPYIYTNDEYALMLFKLAFSDRVYVDITSVVTFNEIKELV